MRHQLYLSLGSNLGNRRQLLLSAIALLGQRVGKVERVSSFIETAPWGFESAHQFLNACVLVSTTLTPRKVLEVTKLIERDLGRTKKSIHGKYGDRPIDIDILLYDHLQVNDDDLVIPHPHMEERDFVMIPLREIMSREMPFTASPACDTDNAHLNGDCSQE